MCRETDSPLVHSRSHAKVCERMGKTTRRIGCGIAWSVCAICLAAVLLFALVPFVNNALAYRTAKAVKSVTLPRDTVYSESFYTAGKLTGNGNGMQYLGGILVKSELSADELADYYANQPGCAERIRVKPQTGQTVAAAEREAPDLRTPIQEDGFYIVYAWGDQPGWLSPFLDLDMRGH